MYKMYQDNLRKINLYLKELIDNEERVNTQNLKNKIYNNEFFYDEMIINELLCQTKILYDYLYEIYNTYNDNYDNVNRVIHLAGYIKNKLELEKNTYGEQDNFKIINKIYRIIILVKEFLTDTQMYNKKYFIELWNNNYLTKFKKLGVEKVYEIK